MMTTKTISTTTTTTTSTRPGAQWVVDVGHPITRDVPPSVCTWQRSAAYPHRYGIVQAIRMLLYWNAVIPGHEKYLRMRNTITGEALEGFPTHLSYRAA
jgi:hypothetical protein